jgi:gliding motility-associated-like protein
MRKIYSLFICLLPIIIARTQPVLQWAGAFNGVNSFSGSDLSNGRSIGVDAQGNVYSAGLFTYSVDFDPGPGQQVLKAGGPFDHGIYISKLNPAGGFLWVKQIPVVIEFSAIEIVVDNPGNVYLTAYFSGTVDMDPGPGTQLMTSIGAHDAFVIKLDANGDLVWVKQFGGPGDTVPSGSAITLDPAGNVVVCGLYNNTVDFDPGPGVFNMTSSYHMEAFIVKLTNNGDFMWAKAFGNYKSTITGVAIMDVKCDRLGNIYTTGNFAGDCDFDPASSSFYLSSGGFADGFVSKLDGQGKYVWARHIGNPINTNNNFVQPRGIDLDSDNNVYTTGTFIGPQDFDPGNAEYMVSSIGGTMDSYVLKLDDHGDFVWVKVIGGSEHEDGADLAIDNENNIYATGVFNGTPDFDPGPGVSTIANLYDESVMTKLDRNGNFIYKAPFRGVGYGSGVWRRLVTDASQNIYITGFFSGTVDFDPGAAIYTLSSGSPYSPFVMKLARCKNVTTSTITTSVCSNYVLNNQVYDKSGTYTQTIPNAAGCDSIITLNLIINKKQTEQSKSICEGEFYHAGSADQFFPGTYKDTLLTALGCDSVVITFLSVNPRPVPSLGNNQNLCRGNSLQVSPGTFNSYEWQDGSRQSTFAISTPGTYWVNVMNEYGCKASDTILVNGFVEVPAGFLKSLDSICQNETRLLSTTQNYSGYQWSNGATTSSTTISTPGDYWLIVSNSDGCSGADTIRILPKQNCQTIVFVPSAFSPNGDGVNDVFRAGVYGPLSSFKLQVFDRSGLLIFQSTDPSRGWAGFYKGVRQPAAAYVWQCFYQFINGQPQYQKGTVTIVR